MPVVCAEGLSFSYSDRVCIFENVDFRLSPGWYGLIGANGLGKTTLGRLIAGELRPTHGRLWLEPEHATVVICRQELTGVPEDLREFARRNDRESARQRGRLGLVSSPLERWNTLSSGERKRWQLGAALARSPEVLILDEPTNHLDRAGRDYLIAALSHFRGVGVVISHDRALLAALTSATLRVERCAVVSYAMSYAQARELWLAATESALLERKRLVQRQHQLEQRVRVTRHELQAAHRQRSARARMKNIHDHDGSSAVATRRAASGESSIGRRVHVMAAELERSHQQLPEFVVDRTLGRSVFLGYQPAPRPCLMSINGEDVFAGDRMLLHDVRIAFTRDARIHLSGPNGSGKTTLLKALLRGSQAKDSILYLPQDLNPADVDAVMTAALELDPIERGRILSILAALGVDPDRILGSVAISPGEARKLKLAFGLATHAWALILDEPTNHLDLPAVERLELALSAYPGAILIVSHDAAFARHCTNHTWEIRGRHLMT
jgi:ATPase subunit of ABC transporter with duplicated ATPase domains